MRLSYARGEVAADSRRRDLTPWRDQEIKGVTSGGEAYFPFLKQAVMPLVETRYRVDRADRTLAGQSYDGLFGLWVAFHEQTLFANYILTSPSMWFADRAVLHSEAAYAATHKDLPARIHLAIGSREHPGPGGCADCDNDMVADPSRLAAMLKSRAYPGLQLRTTVVDDGFHEATFPIGQMQGLQWLYRKGVSHSARPLKAAVADSLPAHRRPAIGAGQQPGRIVAIAQPFQSELDDLQRFRLAAGDENRPSDRRR